MITVTSLANTQHYSQLRILFLVTRRLNIYFLSNFSMHNSLTTSATIPYLTPQDLCYAWKSGTSPMVQWLGLWNSTAVVVAQWLRHVPLCDPMNCSMPGFPVLHSLSEFAQVHVHWVSGAIQPSHPLLTLSPLALNLYQHQGLSQWVRSLH